jgi:hypothetical protein
MNQSEIKQREALKRSLLLAISQGNTVAAKRIAQELRDHYKPEVLVFISHRDGVYKIDEKEFTLEDARIHLQQLQKRSKLRYVAIGTTIDEVGPEGDPLTLISRDQIGRSFVLPDNHR